MNALRRARGFNLIEAMIAIIVLSVGLLALAALQSRLIRASADGKMQSAALAMAKAEIERQRTYRDAATWRDGIIDAPAATVNVSVGGQNFAFTRTTVVDRFRFNPALATPAWQTVADNAALNGQPDFKRINVSVSWTTESGDTRQVNLTDVISSLMPSDSARLVATPSSNRRPPAVRIFAPDQEGIIPIAIGSGQASASSNPKPVQFDSDGGATLTRFNVQTYLNDGGNPLLQRRLEFSYISCQCRGGATTTTATNPGYEPSFWNGLRYTAPRPIVGRAVPQAISQINDQQDVNRFDDLCTACCRDHQDDGNSVTARNLSGADSEPATARRYKVDPFRAVDEYASGNHKHYANTSPAEFLTAPVTLATGTDEYFETCRLVRVDGINRVAIDSRLENFVSLNLSPDQRSNPDNLLATLPDQLVTDYAAFAKKYVENALGLDTSTTPPDTTLALPTGYPVGGLPDQVVSSPGDPTASPPVPPTYTQLAQDYDTRFLDLAEDDTVVLPVNDRYHNLHARGIYIDFLSTEAQQAIACVGNTDRNCAAFRDRNPLELVPFFAVNLTNLAYFRKAQASNVLFLEANGFPQTYGLDFVRGRVRSTASGDLKILASSRRGNAGLTDQIPIYPDASLIVNEGEPFTVGGNQTSSHAALLQRSCPTCANTTPFNQKIGFQIVTSNPDGTTCGAGDPPFNTSAYSRCSLGDSNTITAVTISFTSYVVAGCPNNYTYNASTNQCERVLNNGTTQTQAPSIADYKLCALNGAPAGVTVFVGTPSNTGVPSETTVVTLSGTDVGTLLDATLTAPMTALFTAESNTCP